VQQIAEEPQKKPQTCESCRDDKPGQEYLTGYGAEQRGVYICDECIQRFHDNPKRKARLVFGFLAILALVLAFIGFPYAVESDNAGSAYSWVWLSLACGGPVILGIVMILMLPGIKRSLNSFAVDVAEGQAGANKITPSKEPFWGTGPWMLTTRHHVLVSFALLLLVWVFIRNWEVGLFTLLGAAASACLGLLGGLLVARSTRSFRRDVSSTGGKIDASHEWRTVDGRRMGPTTVAEVYEKYHGRGSWAGQVEKKRRRNTSSAVFFVALLGLIAVLIPESERNPDPSASLFLFQTGIVLVVSYLAVDTGCIKGGAY
jgi:predicted nucleic acid-binding Zn ribbon protein